MTKVTTGEKVGVAIPILLITSGLVVFIVGCSVGIYRDQRNQDETDLEHSSIEVVKPLISFLSGKDGVIDLPRFISRPDIPEDLPGRDGRDMLLRLTTGNEDPFELLYGSRDGRTVTQKGVVLVRLSDGTITSGTLEVTLYG